MTYFQYHLVFIVPLLVILAFLTGRRRGPLAAPFNPDNRWAWLGYTLMPVIAFLYTTPWDNYLVYRQVWTYPPERVLARIGYVPVEEYAFFILQCLITGLFLFWLLRRGVTPAQASPAVRWGGAAALMALAFVGAWCLRQEQTLYLGLILAWAMPVLAFQWAFGGDLILGRARTFWTAVLVPTVYLWLTDAFAIGNGIWQISARYTIGIGIGPLPFEEMLFFLVTNLLVVVGLMLFLHPQSMTRLQAARPYLRPWIGFAGLYLLLKIPVPLWPDGFALLSTLSTASLFLAALSYLWERHGPRVALTCAALGASLGWLIEWLGSTTGLPFGQYTYQGAPGVTLLGVPLLVALGWFAMPLVTTLMAGGRPWLAGLLLVAWDAGLEPLMTAQGFWTWQDARPLWSGAPVQNFLGWFLMGTALSALFGRLIPGLKRPQRDLHPGWVYAVEVVYFPAGLLLLGFPLEAIVTFVCMGVALALTRWGGPLRPLKRSADRQERA